MITLTQGEARLDIDPTVGNLPLWQVGNRVPLHAAPWRDEPDIQRDPTLPMVNKRLAGDFLCMPFGRDDVETDPPHGHTANGPWDVLETHAASARLRLSRPVRGALVEKQIRLAGPVLYQTHTVEGGQGAVSFAHHPMTRMSADGRLSFSPKRAVLTDALPQHAGHNLWSLDQTRPDLTLDCVDGTTWDLRSYPAAHRVEDFVLLVEAEGATIGWTVLMREAEDDMLVVLKDARVMPVTMLWISNGARDFPPWNGRHTGVLGIEDGCAAGAMGLAAALAPNRLTEMGIPTARTLGDLWSIRHAMISLPRPDGWTGIRDLTLADGEATLTEASGTTMSIPFDTEHFA